MTDAPPPPRTLTDAAAHYAKLLGDFVKDTGDPKWIATADAVRVLTLAGNVRLALRAWQAQWAPYEAELVDACRRAGITDTRIAEALGMPRQNLQRRHGVRP